MAGKVVMVGSHVQGISKGDYVSAESHIPCNQCIYCRSGRAHICQKYKILGIDRDGTFAEYLVIPQSVVWKNDPNIPPKFASIQEPLGNAVHVVMEADVAGKSVAVYGVGITGLFAIAVARAVGAVEIFAIDTSSSSTWRKNWELRKP
jgi:threonine 3-dehydrogenase